MKKIMIGLLSVILLVSLSGCTTQSVQKEVGNAIGINCNAGTVESSIDDHDGFLGDGTSFYEISFSDDSFMDEVSSDASWHKLPLENVLTALVYGTKIIGHEEGPYIVDENYNKLFPDIENGYYFFEDRHSDSTKDADYMDILSRYSFNFTIAIYDIDTKTLYFSEYDT